VTGARYRRAEPRAQPSRHEQIPPEPTEEFFKPYFAKQLEILERGQKWVHLVGVRSVVKLPDAKVRNLIAENTKRIDPLSARYNLGAALRVEPTFTLLGPGHAPNAAIAVVPRAQPPHETPQYPVWHLVTTAGLSGIFASFSLS
jgi:hypothetical protein